MKLLFRFRVEVNPFVPHVLNFFFILTVKVGQGELNIKQNKPLTWSVVPNEPAKGIHAMLNTQPTK